MASWFDKCKEEQIFSMQEGIHNKFWAIHADPQTWTVFVRWGRFGIPKPQRQTKPFGNEWAARRFIDEKIAEKRRKGYQLCSKEEFEAANIEAAIVGLRNKIVRIGWFSIVDGMAYKIVSRELMECKCPGLMAEVEIAPNSMQQGGTYVLLFSAEGIFQSLQHGMGGPYRLIPIGTGLAELADKAAAAIGSAM